MAKTQNQSSTAELKELYQNHDTLGISNFLIKHKTHPEFNKLYWQSTDPFENIYERVGKYLGDKKNLIGNHFPKFAEYIRQHPDEVRRISPTPKNPLTEFEALYSEHNTTGMVDFLDRHKTDPQFSDLYEDIVSSRKTLSTAVKDHFSDRGVLKYKSDRTQESRSGLKHRITFVKEHNPLEMLDSFDWLDKSRRAGELDLIALQPRDYFEAYIRENIQDIGSMRLEKAGHDIMVLSYAHKKEIPIFCLGLKTLRSDIENIHRQTTFHNYRDMSSIVNEDNREIVLKEFSNQGLPIN
jgi:hypothetical protein